MYGVGDMRRSAVLETQMSTHARESRAARLVCTAPGPCLDPLDYFMLRIGSEQGGRADCSELPSAKPLCCKAKRDDVGTITRSEQSAIGAIFVVASA